MVGYSIGEKREGYQKCSKVSFLAGGGYDLMGVNVAVFFNGERGQVKGDYALVLWEDNGSPIIRGREILGLP